MCAELHQRVAMPTLIVLIFIYRKVTGTSLYLEAHESFWKIVYEGEI